MKIKYPFLLATLAMLALVFGLVQFGAIGLGRAVCLVVAFQFLVLAISAPQHALFIAALSPAQIKEFGEIMEDLRTMRGIFPGLMELGAIGIENIKSLPDAFDELKRNVDAMRRAGASRARTHEIRPGQGVSDDCAKYLAAIAITIGEKTGALDALNGPQRNSLLTQARSVFGVEHRTALTSSDIPLPTEYSGQVVQLVNMYGSARRYGTVIPLGTGTLKLPRLKTDTTFGLLTQSAPITEKSPQTEWVTFNAEKFGGLIRIPSEISEDSIVSIGNFIADYAARNIARVEDDVFFMNLDGSTLGAVKGLCGSVIDNSKVTQMASTKTHYSDATLANIRALRSVPDAAALRMGAYYMHASFEQHLSGLNTGGDRPYNPNAQLANASSAQPFITGPTLDGFPVRWVPSMPAYSTSANVSKVFMLFGDLSFQYLGIRGGYRFEQSREAAFATDEILVRAIERLTIGLMATGAVGGLETAAS